MNLVTTAARILLGLIFVAAGAMMFLLHSPVPQPGLAGTFNEVFFASHWALFLGAAQFVAGVLLLIDRFVPVASIVLAAFLYNSLAFHLTMMPAGLPMALVVTVLWFIVSRPYRQAFAALFTASPVRSATGKGVQPVESA
jgi:putative oxidoreductase